MSLNAASLFADAAVRDRLKGKSRIALLKEIEAVTAELFRTHEAFGSVRGLLGGGQQVIEAALNQQWVGIPEYSAEWYQVYDACSDRQRLARAFVRYALEQLDHGFDGLDRALIYHGSVVADRYDTWFTAWAKAVQGTDLARKLEADNSAGKVAKELYNHYTIIVEDSSGGYTQVPYATYFKDEIGAIVSAFDAWIEGMERTEGDAAVKASYLAYLTQYRTCLAETEVDKLEGQWRLLDEKWMQIKHWVQIVHDIEYGYGEPLRCKVEPEFSVRLMDETYAAENATIQKIQGIMVEYFRGRDAPLARSGMGALQKSMAGIYYLPYLCGAMLFFRFAGQSIPNRSEVREACGVKIYFDPVSTAAREVHAKQLVEQVCAEPQRANVIKTVETITWHVAAHEVGHAIYGLDNLKDVIKTSTKTLLEEPRAELTAIHTMKLLLEHGMLTKEGVAEHLASFMLQDLRRFSMFDSQAIRPYTVSAMSMWRRGTELGYISLDDNGKVHIDDSKAMDFVVQCSGAFEAILDAEDRNDGPAVEGILAEMEAAESSSIVQHLVDELFHKPRQEKAAA